MAEGRPWRWAITSVFIPNDQSSGHTDTLEDAKSEFATAWRAWLTKTGRDEATYRPLYGRPVDIGERVALMVRYRPGAIVTSFAPCAGR